MQKEEDISKNKRKIRLKVRDFFVSTLANSRKRKKKEEDNNDNMTTTKVSRTKQNTTRNATDGQNQQDSGREAVTKRKQKHEFQPTTSAAQRDTPISPEEGRYNWRSVP